MSVWLTIPSARPFEEAEPVLKLWKERGYKIALWRDKHDPPNFVHWISLADYIIWESYPGYARAVNAMIRRVIEIPKVTGQRDTNPEWFVAGGDDTGPDLKHTADEIARECSEYFLELSGWHLRNSQGWSSSERMHVHDIHRQFSTFGVMQPTGDRFSEGSIDRICGSPWIGREFALRTYGGNGPYWPEYKHMFVDEELQEVAFKLGVLWQRRDLTHLHHHYTRIEGTNQGQESPIPEHLKKWSTLGHWKESKAIFDERKAKGFPGHEVK